MGAFVKRQDMIAKTVRQLEEMKLLTITLTTPDHLTLFMEFNQGMDGASGHPEIFSKETAALEKSGHSLKSCQIFGVVLLRCNVVSNLPEQFLKFDTEYQY